MFPNPPKVVHLNKERYDIRIDHPNKWGNPFHGPTTMSAEERERCIKQYHEWLLTQPQLLADLKELEGKSLGCWCKPKPCHGDVLVQEFLRRWNTL